MIRNVFFVVTAVVFAVVLSSVHTVCGSDYGEGKALYEEKCMICHGQNGKGDGPAAAALSPPPKDFSRAEFWKQKDVEQLITNRVKNGKGAMPAFSLSDDEINTIIDYMSHTFNKSS